MELLNKLFSHGESPKETPEVPEAPEVPAQRFAYRVMVRLVFPGGGGHDEAVTLVSDDDAKAQEVAANFLLADCAQYAPTLFDTWIESKVPWEAPNGTN